MEAGRSSGAMYESFFGLTGPPFRLIPDPSFLFTGKGHRDALAALRVGLAAGARVMVLTGEVGAGKTTLLQALLTSVDPASTVTAQISAAHLDAETLSERLSEVLDLPRQPDPLARRDALLSALPSGPRATLLVIDEAQHLTPSALDLLETLAKATPRAATQLQICLVGQPELRILLNAAQRGGFRELIGADRHLGPLEQAEIRLYVEHRLHRAGWNGRPEFEDAAFSEIFIFTAGNPRRVNLLCNSLLLCACLKKQQRIDAPAVTWAAAAMREDSFHGAPDVLDLGSHFEHRPTLTEAFEPSTRELEATTSQEDKPPWSCPSCGGLNASTAMRCWNCEAARPSLDAAAEAPAETIRAAEALTAASDAMHVDTTMGTHPAEEPASATIGDRKSREPEVTRSDRLAAVMGQEVSAARRRRQAILASVASVAAALALLAYVVGHQGLHTSLSPTEPHDIVGNQTPSLASPRTALDRMRRGVGSVAPDSSAQASTPTRSPDFASRARAIEAAAVKTPQDSAKAHDSIANEVPGATDAAPEHAVPATPGTAETPTPGCSGPAFALGLCEGDSSSKRRQ